MEHAHEAGHLGTVLLAGGLVFSFISIFPPWNVRVWFGGAALACLFAFLLFG